MIPYYLVVTKPHKQNVSLLYFDDVGNDLNDVKNKIIKTLQEEFSIHKDIPESYDDFIYKCWFAEKSIDSDIFNYKVFYNNKWINPWTHDELYENVYEILHKLDLLAGYINDANGLYEDESEDDEKEQTMNL